MRAEVWPNRSLTFLNDDDDYYNKLCEKKVLSFLRMDGSVKFKKL